MARTVKRRYSFNGFAGCVVQRKSQATGTLVGVYNGLQSGLDSDLETPWLAVCEAHGTLVGNKSLALALACTDPNLWCDDCREAQPPATTEI